VSGTVQQLWVLDAPTFPTRRGNQAVGISDPEAEIALPFPAYLIRHSRGWMMFDTSLIPEAAEDASGVYGPRMAERLSFRSEQRVDVQLKGIGVRPEDVRFVILSHLHLDHTGGVALFPNADILVGVGELQYAHWPHPTHQHLYQLDRIDALPPGRWRELPSEDIDFFGDGSIRILSTPGHTPGELSLLLRLRSRNIVLTGDTVHIREALERELIFSSDVDTIASRRSLSKLKLVSTAYDASVWIGHDQDDWKMHGELPASYD
jgi:N-acyl homoserine lactone hydrolase